MVHLKKLLKSDNFDELVSNNDPKKYFEFIVQGTKNQRMKSLRFFVDFLGAEVNYVKMRGSEELHLSEDKINDYARMLQFMNYMGSALSDLAPTLKSTQLPIKIGTGEQLAMVKKSASLKSSSHLLLGQDSFLSEPLNLIQTGANSASSHFHMLNEEMKVMKNRDSYFTDVLFNKVRYYYRSSTEKMINISRFKAHQANKFDRNSSFLEQTLKELLKEDGYLFYFNSLKPIYDIEIKFLGERKFLY